MANPLINNSKKNDEKPNFKAMYEDFSQNPREILANSGIVIPENIGNDPNEIGNFLFNSGKVPPQILNAAIRMYKPFMAWIKNSR